MPHIWVEYSTNLKPEISVPQLLKTAQDAVIGAGTVFPCAGARTRGVPVDEYLIVDGHAANSFVHVLIKIAAGRSLEEKNRMGDRVFQAIQSYLAPVFATRPLGLSVQIEEADPDTNYKSSHYREHLAARQR